MKKIKYSDSIFAGTLREVETLHELISYIECPNCGMEIKHTDTKWMPGEDWHDFHIKCPICGMKYLVVDE